MRSIDSSLLNPFSFSYIRCPGSCAGDDFPTCRQAIWPGRARLVQLVTVGADESDEYHESQLREKPEDTSTHSNYGVFLKERKPQSAERKYRKSTDRNGNYVDALGNLANLLGEKGDRDQAARLYRRTLGGSRERDHDMELRKVLIERI